MARTMITSSMIKKINKLYYESKNYSAVGRELGISPPTVKRYVDPNYVPEELLSITPIDIAEIRARIELYVISKKEMQNPSVLSYTDEEREAVIEFQKELSL